MRSFLMFCRHTLKQPLVWLIVVTLFLISFFSFGYAAVNKNLPCAVCSEDVSENAQAVMDSLDPEYFLVCSSRSEVLSLMRRGRVDCGAVLLPGFGQRMEQFSMDQCTEFLVSPRTSLEAMYKFLLLITIYNEYTPYLTITGFKEFGLSITLEEVHEYFRRIKPEITPLSFVVTNVDGVSVDLVPSIDLPIGLIAIAGFLAYGFYAIGIVRRRGNRVKARFSKWSMLSEVFWPRLIPACLLLFAGSAIGVILGQSFLSFPVGSVILGLGLYYLLLTILFSVLIQLPFSDHVLICIVALDASISLLMCPLFWDISLFISWFKMLRIICVPYWLYLLI